MVRVESSVCSSAHHATPDRRRSARRGPSGAALPAQRCARPVRSPVRRAAPALHARLLTTQPAALAGRGEESHGEEDEERGDEERDCSRPPWPPHSRLLASAAATRTRRAAAPGGGLRGHCAYSPCATALCCPPAPLVRSAAALTL
jgi:hypothetical protein